MSVIRARRAARLGLLFLLPIALGTCQRRPPLDYKDAALPVEQRVASLLALMTLEEKIAQLYPPVDDEEGKLTPEAIIERFPNGVSAVGRVGLKRTPGETATYVNSLQKLLMTRTRLGIPAFVIDEALHGLMAFQSTSFPQAIALACTFDPELVQQAFTVAAAEARSRGTNWVLTPVLDLARDPRWGRTDETYGEDPYLVSRMGVAAVRGLQGRGPAVDGEHVLATAKHFAVHGQPEAGTNGAPGNFAERIVREQFLVPFQAVVTEAGVHSVMASYNEINGVPSHINRWLLTDVLRGEWRFGGFVTSDGGAIEELVKLHAVAATRDEAARKSMEAGIDYELGNTFETLTKQVKENKLSMSTVDAAVARVLRAKFLLGLFDTALVDPTRADGLNNNAAARALALRAAREAVVLLKNDKGVLPLDRSKLKSVAVLGPNAAEAHLGSYSVDPGHTVSILDGIKAKLGDRVKVHHAVGCRITAGNDTWQGWWKDEVVAADTKDDEAGIAEAARLAKESDVAIVVVGENEATCREGWSAKHLGDRDSLDLLGSQDALVKAVVETGTPTVVILVNGRPLSVNAVAASASALIEGFYLGQEGGTAMADVLFGDYNPGGRLAITFPRSVGQIPAYYYHKPSGRRGYLFTSKEPLFPFGYGLSYTTFQYSAPRLSAAKIGVAGKTTVSVDVTDTGKLAGDEVVQMYVHDRAASLTRPVKELKGFQRVSLKPGETRTVNLELSAEQLAFYGEGMRRTVEPGAFDIMVGPSSASLQTVTLDVEDE